MINYVNKIPDSEHQHYLKVYNKIQSMKETIRQSPSEYTKIIRTGQKKMYLWHDDFSPREVLDLTLYIKKDCCSSLIYRFNRKNMPDEFFMAWEKDSGIVYEFSLNNIKNGDRLLHKNNDILMLFFKDSKRSYMLFYEGSKHYMYYTFNKHTEDTSPSLYNMLQMIIPNEEEINFLNRQPLSGYVTHGEV